MALARNRVNINFTLPGGQAASVGWDWQPSAIVTTFGDLLTWGAAICTSLQANFTTSMSSLRAALSGQASINGVTCQYFTGTTLVVGAFAPIGAALAGSGTNNLPQQNCLVISLVSNFSGRSHRGRTYWPLLAAVVGTTGKLTTPTLATFLTHFSFLLGVIDASVPAPNVSVSGLRIYSSTLDAITKPSILRVNDVADVQRRRQDALVPTVASQNY